MKIYLSLAQKISKSENLLFLAYFRGIQCLQPGRVNINLISPKYLKNF